MCILMWLELFCCGLDLPESSQIIWMIQKQDTFAVKPDIRDGAC
jgi:hypothetical protein